MQYGSNVFAYIDVGDVDGEYLKGCTCIKAFLQYQFGDGIGVSAGVLGLAQPVKTTVATPSAETKPKARLPRRLLGASGPLLGFHLRLRGRIGILP